MSNPTGDALTHSHVKLGKCSEEWLKQLQNAENLSLATPQLSLTTEHIFHAGMYARTIRIEAGTMLTGALMLIPTLLVCHGRGMFFTEEGGFSFDGFVVLPGSAGRKTALAAHTDVEMTMIFPTQAQTVEEAEQEFTSEYEKLMSRKSDSDSVIHTGE